MKRFEKWLFVNEHQDKYGQWSRRYYAMFIPWNETKPKTWPLGENLALARGKLERLRSLNEARVEVILDEERERREALAQTNKLKEEATKGLTLSEWSEHYFNKIAPSLDKRERTIDRERGLWERLQNHFGPMELSKIKFTATAEYRIKREKEVSFVTVNRELAFVRYLLNCALDDGALEAAPRIKLKSENDRGRERTLSPEEYAAIISHMGREQARYYVALHETGMRLREPLKLTWDKVDFGAGLIRLRAEDVKEKYPRRTPISWEFQQVLTELRREQSKIPNVGGFVFTRKNGKPIKTVREAWLKAVAEAVKAKQLANDDVVPHDFRRTAITRWTALGIPRDVVMACSGHKPNGVHDGYVNFSDAQLVEAFANAGLLLPPSQRKKAVKARAKAV
jgi:integrase